MKSFHRTGRTLFFHHLHSLLIAALIVAASGFVLPASTARAANFSPATVADLITAINTANSNNADDVIDLGGSTFTLTAVNNPDNGLPSISSDNSHRLTIQNGTITRGAAAPDLRILFVDFGANLTLNNATISNGRLVSADGAGIYNSGVLTLTNSTVSGNTQNSTFPSGAGIYNVGTLTITNSTISNNTQSGNNAKGAGIFNSGPLTLTNSTVSGNTQSRDFAVGAGIYNDNGTLTLTQSTVSGNTQSGNNDTRGAGIYNYYGALTLTQSTVSGNTQSGNYAQGAGIYNANGALTLTQSTVSGNTQSGTDSFGAGIYNDYSTLTVSGSTFSGNHTVERGGAIYNYSTGGTCASAAAVTISNSTFSGNTALGGGGISNEQGVISLLYNTFTANTSMVGGGIYSLNDGSTCTKAGGNIIYDNTGGDVAAGGPPTQRYFSLGYNLVGMAGVNVDFTQEFNQAGDLTVSYDPLLGALQNNGGPTQTHALQAGSAAIDAGGTTLCAAAPVSNADQRGATRPQASACDIGAYELDSSFPTVVADSLVASYAVGAGPSNFTVTFNENVADPAGDTGSDDVTNPANYIVVEDGANSAFDTASCAGGVAGDDIQATVVSVTYNSALYTSTVTLGGPLPSGSYRLFVCGTTSIIDNAANTLNNGLSDYTFDFVVNMAPTPTPTIPPTPTPSTADSLPNTGFAPNKVTILPIQPAELAYSALGDIWLEIPSLNVKSTIVGVPQADNGAWNVDWLGADTGWLNGSAFPTWNGNSVLTAHVTDANGLPGPFASIKDLKYGERIIVHLYGQKYVYEITDSRMSFPSATGFAFQSMQDHSYLTLVTCQGYNPVSESYLFRRVVRAVLIEVK